jgi:DNA repair protein RadA/Sms
MAKAKTVFLCDDCGYESANWYGKCPSCGSWNTMRELRVQPAAAHAAAASAVSGGVPAAAAVTIDSIDRVDEVRVTSGIRELDRVLGGGVVQGSVVLIGGDPGIGKSTLLLQICGHMADAGMRVCYISGEESLRQIAMRAQRTGVSKSAVRLVSHTVTQEVLSVAAQEAPQILVVDSIQTMACTDISGAPGSVTQVRESAARFVRYAKECGTAVFLVGHVTKEGAIAGPRILEHMVDTVLYFEGDPRHDHRILRAVKNRFGSTNEIGIFRMCDSGMVPVEDPSGILLFRRESPVAGCAVVCTLEGTRPMNVEVQALTAPTAYGTARRMAAGFDHNRMALLLAVLEKKAGLPLANQDAYVNIAGGLRLDDPGADLAVCAAIASSFCGRAVAQNTAFIGEVGLTGEVRAVAQMQRRLHECAALGFVRIVTAPLSADVSIPDGAEVLCVDDVRDMIRRFFGVQRKSE